MEQDIFRGCKNDSWTCHRMQRHAAADALQNNRRVPQNKSP
ncbi:hypothetical protein OCAR_7247 [Afipia carboxidovorans OM5]|nr:hypothetical protein OCAR_7247 [Afipia carboxidovorans OM5]